MTIITLYKRQNWFSVTVNIIEVKLKAKKLPSWTARLAEANLLTSSELLWIKCQSCNVNGSLK